MMPPVQPVVPAIPPVQQETVPPLNWSNCQSEFAGKPEDAEANLLLTNDWMDIHTFPEGVTVQWFCLTFGR